MRRTGKQLHRVLKYGGVAVMVVQDQTRNYAKTLTSFRTILDWCDNAGFRLFETVIYQRKHAIGGAGVEQGGFVSITNICRSSSRETGPAYFNKAHLAVHCKTAGKRIKVAQRRADGSMVPSKKSSIVAATKCRGTIWPYANPTAHNPLKKQHPATFSDHIPYDFIECFCPPGGVVLDPFNGSGTSVVAAKKLNRKFIGIDISEDYCRIARARLERET